MYLLSSTDVIFFVFLSSYLTVQNTYIHKSYKLFSTHRTWHRNIDGNLVAADTVQICNSKNLNADCSDLNDHNQSGRSKNGPTRVEMYVLLSALIGGLCFSIACFGYPIGLLLKGFNDRRSERERARARTHAVPTSDSAILYETAYDNDTHNWFSMQQSGYKKDIGNNDIGDNGNDIEERLTLSSSEEGVRDDDCVLPPSNEPFDTMPTSSLLHSSLSIST